MANPIEDFIKPAAPKKSGAKKPAAAKARTTIKKSAAKKATTIVESGIDAVSEMVDQTTKPKPVYASGGNVGLSNSTIVDIEDPSNALALSAYNQLLHKPETPVTEVTPDPEVPIAIAPIELPVVAAPVATEPIAVNIAVALAEYEPEEIENSDFIDPDALNYEETAIAEQHAATAVTGIVYLITCVVNGKKYVGQTGGLLDHRWKGHQYNTRYPGRRTRFSFAIMEFGPENFTTEILATVPLDQLNALEKAAIITHDSMHPNGYNSTSGGSSGTVMSQETRDKRSAALRGLARDNRARRLHDADSTLPKYICGIYRENTLVGYTVSGHPNMFGSSRGFSTGGDLALNLEKAKSCLESVENGEFIPKHSSILPEGVTGEGHGFAAKFGTPKFFIDPRLSRDEKFNAAARHNYILQILAIKAGELTEAELTPIVDYLQFCKYESYEKHLSAIEQHLKDIVAISDGNKTKIRSKRDAIKALRQAQKARERDDANLPLQMCYTPNGVAVICLDKVHYFHNGAAEAKLNEAYKHLSDCTGIPVDSLKASGKCAIPDSFKVESVVRPNTTEKKLDVTFSDGSKYIVQCNGQSPDAATAAFRLRVLWHRKNYQRDVLLKKLISDHYKADMLI